MKKERIIYWSTTGILALMMLFSAYSYFTAAEVVDGFKKMGFPDFFRVELGVAKVLGALVLIIPKIPSRVKEWAYAGFGITFISASIAHYKMGDLPVHIVTPLIFLGILAVSNIYLHKLNSKGA